MPELPDIAAYVSALEERIAGAPLERVRLARNPIVLRTVDPPLASVAGRTVREVRRIGKRIALGLDGGLWIVLHLMIAGRLHWRAAGARIGGPNDLAAFDFPAGTLTLTEAGSKHRASIHVLQGDAALAAIDPGGLDVLSADRETFRQTLSAENRTLKRALTDPKVVDGIGNAYSDEILHAARLSPATLTRSLKPEQWDRLYDATRATLQLWIDRLREEASVNFPEKVTAFRKDMAVHGRFGLPCPACAFPVQRIRYEDNETNYCAHCQTGGKLLADRSLSRLLKGAWPRTIGDVQTRKKREV